MDLFLALEFVHALSVIVWLAGGAVLALILLAAGRDARASLRAVTESDLIGRRVLRPASAATLATGLVLAALAGALDEAWVVLGALLVLASLLARPLLLRPALDAAAAGPGPLARALGLVRLDLAAQGAVAVLMVAQPGWAGAAILAGLVTCLALALALLRSLGDGLVLPS